MAEKRINQDMLEQLLKEAEQAHAAYEQRLGRRDDDWPAWYANYIVERLPDAGPSIPLRSTEPDVSE